MSLAEGVFLVSFSLFVGHLTSVLSVLGVYEYSASRADMCS
jgi:hypothetical protein